MASLKWNCIALMAVLVSSSMCSATHRVRISTVSSPMAEDIDEPKFRVLGETTDHSLHEAAHGGIVTNGGGGGGGGGWSSSGGQGYGYGGGSYGGGGGGGWSSTGSGPGYGYGHGTGGGGGGGWSSGGEGYGYGYGGGDSGEYYPPRSPFHCQPINCGNPNGCPGFVFHFTSKMPTTAQNIVNDAAKDDNSKKDSNSKSSEKSG